MTRRSEVVDDELNDKIKSALTYDTGLGVDGHHLRGSGLPL